MPNLYSSVSRLRLQHCNAVHVGLIDFSSKNPSLIDDVIDVSIPLFDKSVFRPMTNPPSPLYSLYFRHESEQVRNQGSVIGVAFAAFAPVSDDDLHNLLIEARVGDGESCSQDKMLKTSVVLLSLAL